MCRTLGCTHRELQSRMSYRELTQWIAAYSIEPWGDVRVDRGAAIVAAVTANAHRGKRGKKYSVSDFMPDWKVRRVRQTAAQMAAIAMAWTQKVGGRIIKRNVDTDPQNAHRDRGERRRS